MKRIRHMIFVFVLLWAALATPRPAWAQTRLATPSSPQFAKKWDAQNFSHRLFDSLLRRHVKKGQVDFAGMRRYSMPLLREYHYRLANTRPSQLKGGKASRLAFWINAHNALVLRSTLQRGSAAPVARKRSKGAVRGKGRSQYAFQVGGKWHTLAQIRDRIIRARFKDPRALFALVGTSPTGPWLRSRAYTGRKLARRLRVVARRYLSHPKRGVRLDRNKKIVWLPRLFSGLGKDFNRPPYKGALDFVSGHLRNAQDAAFIKANLAKLTVRYR